VLGAVVFALVVLATGMPVSALLAQRHQLSSASTELARLHEENGSLEHQARQLSDSATVGALARTEYGLVPNGDKAYDILPAPGTSAGTASSTGLVPLNGPPVVPGSGESQSLLGLASSHSSSQGAVAGKAGSGHAAATPGLWGRVLDTLEFWR
jgi:hypothetical protein